MKDNKIILIDFDPKEITQEIIATMRKALGEHIAIIMVNELNKVQAGERYIIAGKELPVMTREEFMVKYGELRELENNKIEIENVVLIKPYEGPMFFTENNKGPIGAILPKGRKRK